MVVRYVLYHPELGVFLGPASAETEDGEEVGLAAWSRVYADRDNALTFHCPEEASAMTPRANGWPPEIEVRQVYSETVFAPMAACVAAGLPRWEVGKRELDAETAERVFRDLGMCLLTSITDEAGALIRSRIPDVPVDPEAERTLEKITEQIFFAFVGQDSGMCAACGQPLV